MGCRIRAKLPGHAAYTSSGKPSRPGCLPLRLLPALQSASTSARVGTRDRTRSQLTGSRRPDLRAASSLASRAASMTPAHSWAATYPSQRSRPSRTLEASSPDGSLTAGAAVTRLCLEEAQVRLILRRPSYASRWRRSLKATPTSLALASTSAYLSAAMHNFRTAPRMSEMRSAHATVREKGRRSPSSCAVCTVASSTARAKARLVRTVSGRKPCLSPEARRTHVGSARTLTTSASTMTDSRTTRPSSARRASADPPVCQRLRPSLPLEAPAQPLKHSAEHRRPCEMSARRQAFLEAALALMMHQVVPLTHGTRGAVGRRGQ